MLHVPPSGFTLRPYQDTLKSQVYEQWRLGKKWVLMRLDTGGGKSATLGKIIQENNGGACVMAHRNELVSQLSEMLSRYGITHEVICAEKTRKEIAKMHMREFGRVFLDPNASVRVASVDTLKGAKNIEGWLQSVTLVVVDETHHLVMDNKWHKAVQRFTHPNLRGLGVTATPERADGKGLGCPEIGGDGIYEVMVQGPTMRWLIDQGYLTDYDIAISETDLAHISEAVSANGDWSAQALKKAAQKSQICGDVVGEYKRLAWGKLGVTFSTDVETAKKQVQEFRLAGVPAELLTGETPIETRQDIIGRFKRREIWQIVAIDIISEGFDLPAIEVVSFARPTMSLAMYMQQFGRSLRLMAGKIKALIIDHVGNFKRHGPPDKLRDWSLISTVRGSRTPSDAVPTRVCLNIYCGLSYRRILDACPHCNTPAPEPEGRGSPQQVDGDLTLLSPEILAVLRGEVQELDKDIEEYRADLMTKHVKHFHLLGLVNKRAAAQEAQGVLRQTIELWVRHRVQDGLKDRQIHKLFFWRFGVDIVSVRALTTTAAYEMANKVAVDVPNSLDEAVMAGY